MNFKLLYIFGFFFIGVKSRSFLPDSESVPLPDYGNTGSSNGNEKPSGNTETAWDKIRKLGNHLQPTADKLSGLKDELPKLGNHLQSTADKLSGLKDKLPKEWKNPFAKKQDEDELGLGNLFGEEPEKKSFLDGINPKEALNKATNGFKLPKPDWMNWGKNNEESPSKDEEPYEGLKNMFGEGDENPEKMSLLDRLNAKEHLNKLKDGISGITTPDWMKLGDEDENAESPSNLDEEPFDGFGNMFGEEGESPKEKSLLDKLNPKEAFDKVRNGIKIPKKPDWLNFGNEDKGAESPESHSKLYDDPYFGIGNMFGEEDENPKEKSLLEKLNPKEAFDKVKNGIKIPKKPDWLNFGNKDKGAESPESHSKLDDDPYDGIGNLFGEDGENPKAKSFLEKLNPKETYDKTKDAITNADWWPFKKNKNHNGGSPTDDVEYDNDEYPHKEKSEPHHGDPYLNGLDEEPGDAEEEKHHPHEGPSENPHHWPINGWQNLLHPKGSEEPHEDASEKNPHHPPETLGELLEEELEDLEKEAEKEIEHPKNPSYEWPKWSWDDDIHEEPKAEKHHSKEHEHGDKPHHNNFPDSSGNHPKDKEHTGSPEKGSKEHGKEDTSNPDFMFPDWFGKSEEHPTPKSHDQESEEEYESPEVKDSHSPDSHSPHHEVQHAGKEHPRGSFIPEVPSWLFADKQPEPEEHEHKKHHGKHHGHHKHPQLLEETFYDVRGIGDSRKSEQAHGKSDDEEEDDDDDDDDDDDENGNETDGNDTEDDNEIGHEEEKDDYIDPDEAEILKELDEKNKSKPKSKNKPKRDSDDEADDDSSDSDDDDEDDDDNDDDAENDAIFDNVEKDFSIWNIVLSMAAKNLPSIPNPFSLMNRVTVSFGSINDLQRDPEYLQKSLIKKVNQKYKEKNGSTLPGTTISVWPPTISRG